MLASFQLPVPVASATANWKLTTETTSTTPGTPSPLASRAGAACHDVGLERGVLFLVGDPNQSVLVAGEEEPADDRQARVLRRADEEHAQLFAAAGAAEGQNRRIPQLVAVLGLDDA